MLTEIVGPVQVDGDGRLKFEYESTAVFVNVYEFLEDKTTVNVMSPVAFDVPGSPDLYKYIATEATGFRFGSVTLVGDGPTHGVMFTHVLLGDTLDPDELEAAVLAVAFTADDLDDAIVGRFGGRRYADT